MDKNKGMRLYFRLLIPLTVLIFFAFLLLTFLLVDYERSKERLRIQNKADRVASLLISANLEAMWNYDSKALRTSSEAFFQDNEIRKISIRDSHGKILINLAKPKLDAPEIIRNALFIRGEKNIGSLEITYTEHFIQKNILNIQKSIGLLFLGSFLLLVVLIHWVAKFALKQLPALNEGVARLGEGDVSHRVPVMQNDELGKLARSFNQMAAELQDHQEHLEEMIRERTHELEVSNQRLKETMAELWGEMQLAKKIQGILLPKNPQLPGYDIAAYQQAADEVGGDYYDILTIQGRHWLIIGDVSGHGVPAGLVMMMVQTAAHTILLGNPNISSLQLISSVNKTIANNIKLLGEDKYMTITVLACEEDGDFAFSGLHQDIFIYRAEEGSVEAVETNGMWIGLLPDVEDMLKIDRLKVRPGDTMLLFTDGLVEALGPGEELFGNERLKDILLEYGHKSPPELQRIIQKALEPYDKRDDVTFLIIHRQETNG